MLKQFVSEMPPPLGFDAFDSDEHQRWRDLYTQCLKLESQVDEDDENMQLLECSHLFGLLSGGQLPDERVESYSTHRNPLLPLQHATLKWWVLRLATLKEWHPEGEEASWVLSGRWPSRVRWWQRARCPRFWQRRPSVLGDCCRGGAYYVSTIDSDDFDLHPELLRKRDSVFPVTPKGNFRLAQFGQVLQDIEAEPEGDEEGEGKAQAEEEEAKEENQQEQGSGEEEQADEEP